MAKTNEEYVDRYGHCPYCDSDQVEGGSSDFEGNLVYLEVWCLDCDKRWDDIYKLIGYNTRG